MTLYKEDLDGMNCEAPGCDHSAHAGDALYIHSRCCDLAGVAVYLDGKIMVECPACGTPVVEIAVARRDGR